ncbi:hypothetical protein Aperf_G00000042833 [Anoplocephala perfoliata]
MDVSEKVRKISGEERLSTSYTPGFEYFSLTSSSPLASAIGSLAISQQQKTRDSSSSPTRFCIQTKDRFVVRVVKVTNRKSAKPLAKSENSQFTQFEKLNSVWQDPQKRQKLQKVLLEAVKENNSSVFIGFQAQLPAVTMRYVLKSTSADQVNMPNGSLIFRQCNLGKGIRLSFSCPLMGSGLKIENFYSGSIYQRLEGWERSSGKPGLLSDVLKALIKAISLLLEQIQKNGFLTVLPEVDYIFYPFTPQALFSQKTLPTIGSSTNSTESRRVDALGSSSQSGSLAPPLVPSSTSSPIVVPGARGRTSQLISTMATPYQGLQRNRNPLLASLMNNPRPLSAYGSCFDGNSAETQAPHLLDRQISLSAGEYGSPVRYMLECNPFEVHIIKDLQETSTRPSSTNSICQTDYNETPTDRISSCTFASASRSPSTWWPSRLGSPVCATMEVCGFDQTPSPQPPPPPLRAYPNTQSAGETPSFSIPIESDPMTAVINEVADRLRRSPQLPLVVMPTQVPGSPPMVFQLPSPDVIFVGFPATSTPHGHERPRLVTSPADNSAFVVTSKRSAVTPTGLLPGNISGERVIGSRFTITAPNPGYILGISAEGDLYEFKPSDSST